MTSTAREQDKVLDAADAIYRYLGKRPNAMETVEGVANWWLLQQRFEDSRALVQEALNYLEQHGQVERLDTPGGTVMYRKAAGSTDQ